MFHVNINTFIYEYKPLFFGWMSQWHILFHLFQEFIMALIWMRTLLLWISWFSSFNKMSKRHVQCSRHLWWKLVWLNKHCFLKTDWCHWLENWRKYNGHYCCWWLRQREKPKTRSQSQLIYEKEHVEWCFDEIQLLQAIFRCFFDCTIKMFMYKYKYKYNMNLLWMCLI